MHRINWPMVLGLAGCLAFWGVVMSYALHRMYDIGLGGGRHRPLVHHPQRQRHHVAGGGGAGSLMVNSSTATGGSGGTSCVANDCGPDWTLAQWPTVPTVDEARKLLMKAY